MENNNGPISTGLVVKITYLLYPVRLRHNVKYSDGTMWALFIYKFSARNSHLGALLMKFSVGYWSSWQNPSTIYK